ncbi:hypothetical protein RND15_53860, partial [Streptomyces sp. DSM 41529]|nr:hypothetical protein [Streptomyces sp. DSM 41529]
ALRITVIGTGYLGATHAAAMAELGFEVLGLDVVPEKIELLSTGRVPMYEPGLEEMLQRHVAGIEGSTGRLRFSEPLAPRQELPYGCLRSGGAAVLCETGGRRSRGGARQTALDLKLASSPDEVVVRLDTVWN